VKIIPLASLRTVQRGLLKCAEKPFQPIAKPTVKGRTLDRGEVNGISIVEEGGFHGSTRYLMECDLGEVLDLYWRVPAVKDSVL
jgi:hypothetical protein